MHITQIKGHTDGSSLLMDIKCCLVGINVEFNRPYYGCLESHNLSTLSMTT